MIDIIYSNNRLNTAVHLYLFKSLIDGQHDRSCRIFIHAAMLAKRDRSEGRTLGVDRLRVGQALRLEGEARRRAHIDTTELLRITKSIKTLDKEVGLVDYIDCFMAFGQWMTQHAEHAEAIRETMSSRTDFWENFTKAVNIIQDKYITSLTKDGGQR